MRESWARGGGDSCLNRNVIGLAVNRFLSDFGHEAGTSVLPLFLAAIGRLRALSASLRASLMGYRALRNCSAVGWATAGSAASRGPRRAISSPA